MASEKRLIYADEARAAVLRENPAIAYCIDRVKTVDAVEVVRCKGCYFLGWRGTNTNDCGYFYCRHPSGLKVIKNAHTSYCDFGERKNNEKRV